MGSEPLQRARWDGQQALCAVRYHTKLVQLLLEKLDLPFHRLQELRFSIARHADLGSPSSSKLGHASSAKPRRELLQCPLWSDVWASVLEPCEAGSSQAGVACLSQEEVELVTEIELHLCAALRQLCRAGRQVSPMHGKVFTKALQGSPATMAADSDQSEVREALVEAAWAFLIYCQLITALCSGDVLLLAAWAFRLLGIAVPWSLKRLQELCLLTLELLVESPCAIGEEDRTAKALMSKIGAIYLQASIIPRFSSRLERCVDKLRELRILRSLDEGTNQDGQSPPAEFDATGRGLRSVRETDPTFLAFCRTIQNSASGHLDVGCPLEPSTKLLAEAKALFALATCPAGGEQQRQWLLEVLAVARQDQTPEAPHSSFCLDVVDEMLENQDDHVDQNGLLEPIGLADVRLDMQKPEPGIASPPAAASRCGSLCCGGAMDPRHGHSVSR